MWPEMSRKAQGSTPTICKRFYSKLLANRALPGRSRYNRKSIADRLWESFSKKTHSKRLIKIDGSTAHD